MSRPCSSWWLFLLSQLLFSLRYRTTCRARRARAMCVSSSGRSCPRSTRASPGTGGPGLLPGGRHHCPLRDGEPDFSSKANWRPCRCPRFSPKIELSGVLFGHRAGGWKPRFVQGHLTTVGTVCAVRAVPGEPVQRNNKPPPRSTLQSSGAALATVYKLLDGTVHGGP